MYPKLGIFSGWIEQNQCSWWCKTKTWHKYSNTGRFLLGAFLCGGLVMWNLLAMWKKSNVLGELKKLVTTGASSGAHFFKEQCRESWFSRLALNFISFSLSGTAGYSRKLYVCWWMSGEFSRHCQETVQSFLYNKSLLNYRLLLSGKSYLQSCSCAWRVESSLRHVSTLTRMR